MVEGAAEILVEGLGKEGGEGGHDLQEGGGGVERCGECQKDGAVSSDLS